MKFLALRTALFLAVALSGMALLGPVTALATQKEKQPEKVYEVKEGDGLKIAGELKTGDPKDKVQKDSHHKVFLVKLSAGKNYTIRMNAKDEDELDSFLRLEDAAGKELAANDDENEDTLDSRINFRSEKDGTYRIICTSFNEGETGEFTLLIKQAK